MQIIADAAVNAAPSYNETEIRFHILDPLIRHLGYPDTDDVYLNLEEKLDYPYVHVGRRSKKDLPLGFPDYRAGIKGARGSFIVEAKAGSISITSKEVEQAHSYAAHAQVGANYFVLCNGSVLQVFETLSGADAVPLIDVPINEINQRIHQIENILSPHNLAKNCHISHDLGLKLADGLGSSVGIRSGRYLLADYAYRIVAGGQDCTEMARQSVPQLAETDRQLELMKTAFELKVSGGVAERGENGRISAHVQFEGATVHNHEAMAILGITEASFATADQFISTDPASPTIFESLKDFSVSRGTMMPELFGGSSEMEGDVVGDMFIKAAMVLSGNRILGEYISLSNHHLTIPGFPPILYEMDFSGTFELTLDC
ncbi:type I restriction enzyme HsdR N-terminal domain-containing protein [Roseobacter sp. MH60115]|uniref:type I restriction enzyme HsdR N-terminal domain-containing protein n=1 Tax=Roseobacter sp. MH60115 TaxID=2785324 RepID=UPI0018A24CA7|nr:type I restriction enzyme HsdR N-terminal domain-containing protein [Roseobacter sp. MH60115]